MRAQVPYLLPSVSPPQTPAGTCECQVVRSLSDWSGCNRTEDSIAQVHSSAIYKKPLMRLNITVCVVSCVVCRVGARPTTS